MLIKIFFIVIIFMSFIGSVSEKNETASKNLTQITVASLISFAIVLCFGGVA